LAGGHAGDALGAFNGGREFFAVVLLEGGFVVEEVDVRNVRRVARRWKFRIGFIIAW